MQPGDLEPKNGDFAAYVDELMRRSQLDAERARRDAAHAAADAAARTARQPAGLQETLRSPESPRMPGLPPMPEPAGPSAGPARPTPGSGAPAGPPDLDEVGRRVLDVLDRLSHRRGGAADSSGARRLPSGMPRRTGPGAPGRHAPASGGLPPLATVLHLLSLGLAVIGVLLILLAILPPRPILVGSPFPGFATLFAALFVHRRARSLR